MENEKRKKVKQINWSYFLIICLNIKTYLHSKRGHVLLLKLSSQMSLDEGGLAGTSISNQDQLKGRHIFSCSHDEGIGQL